jgi:exodeoxyribonuclease V alpha subunit
MKDGHIKVKCKLQKLLFPKSGDPDDSDFHIASFRVIEEIKGIVEHVSPQYGTFTVKGGIMFDKDNMSKPLTLIIKEDLKSDPKYQRGYEVVQTVNFVDMSNAKEAKTFLDFFLTEKQVEMLYEILDNPIAFIDKGDVKALCTVPGIGESRAKKIIDEYQKNKDRAEIIVKLSPYLTEAQINKVVMKFGERKAIKYTLTDTFELLEVPGFGFKTVDNIFLSTGGDPYDVKRIVRAIEFILDEARMMDGCSWLPASYNPQNEREKGGCIQRLAGIIPDVPSDLISQAVVAGIKLFRVSSDGSMIGLEKQAAEEEEIVNYLEGLKSSKTIIAAPRHEIEEAIEKSEQQEIEEKGPHFKYSENQRDGVHFVFDTNVGMIVGAAGSGKSTSAKVAIKKTKKMGYRVGCCALSGQAADNLRRATGHNAMTIHRLLGFSPDGGFKKNEHNKLPHDFIVLDEISMVPTWLFLALIKAIKKGAKLIILGDYFQLESIGIGVMGPLLKELAIPVFELTQIFRQQGESGVLEAATMVRNKQNPFTGDSRTIGTLRDMHWVNIKEQDSKSQSDAILEQAYVRFTKLVDEGREISDIQLLSQTKANCFVLNFNCQNYYNPDRGEKEQVEMFKGAKGAYTLRVGDKVICMKNNYSAMDALEKFETSVFNGSTGILTDIIMWKDPNKGNAKEKKYLVIDFVGIGLLMIEEASFETIALGYAISVHKSQGATIPYVICALPSQFLLNTYRLVYTAITRAKSECWVISNSKVMSRAVTQEEQLRRTFLEFFLKRFNKVGEQ